MQYFDESAKPSPDTAKLANMKAGYQQAGQTYGQICGSGGQ